MKTITHSHMENELEQLKRDMVEMWETVISQVEKASEVVRKNKSDLINEMAAGEKRIDAFELKIDMDCESLLALYGPVANDLRFVLAVLKINYNLERIGDFAWGTAKAIRDTNPYTKESIEKSNLNLMFETSIEMLKSSLLAFETDNNQLASLIFDKDRILDDINKNAEKVIIELINAHPKSTLSHLNLFSTIRKIERMGDHTKNIAEEIIFYIEAKVLRHKRKNKK